MPQRRIGKFTVELLSDLEMIQERMALGAEGIQVVNLADLFNDTPMDIFVDRIHLNSEGQRILLEKIVETLVAKWGLKPKRSNR